MPYKRKYKYPKNSYKNKNNTKRKWRQQKLAVGTVAKIAKRVANFQIQKKLEPKWTNLLLGTPSTTLDGRDITCCSYRSGIYSVSQSPTGFLTSAIQLRSQHHPQTFPVTSNGPAQPILSGKETRVGDTIEMTALLVQGYFKLGANLDNATVRVSLAHACATIQDPAFLLPDVNGMQIRRTIDNTEELNILKNKYFTINHNAGGNDREKRLNFKIYFKFKKPRRIRYNEGQNTAFPINQNSYQDHRYYLIVKSDVPDPNPNGGLNPNTPNAQLDQVLSNSLQFYARWTAYYKDA